MSGPKTKPSEDIANRQVALGERSEKSSQEDRARMLELMAPAIDFYKSFTGGDRTKMTAAAAPVIGEIGYAARAAKESIFENVPAGPARDFALAKLERDRYTDVAKATTEPYLSSFDKLANISSGFGAFSLQGLGAGARGYEGASITQDSVMKAKAEADRDKMGLISSLASTAGRTAVGLK